MARNSLGILTEFQKSGCVPFSPFTRFARASWAPGFDVAGNTPQGCREEVQEEVTHGAMDINAFHIKVESPLTRIVSRSLTPGERA